jgi:hypothetical protein
MFSTGLSTGRGRKVPA